MFPRSLRFLKRNASDKQRIKLTTMRIICTVPYALGGVISRAIECIKLSIMFMFLPFVIIESIFSDFCQHIHYNTFRAKIKGDKILNFLNKDY